MSVRQVAPGATDVSVTLRIVDSGDGTPETGVVFNTAGIDLWYRRDGAASVDIAEATLSALTDAHADGGFLHINDGWYRLDLPDAAVAAGVAGVQIGGTVTGMVVFGPYIELRADAPTVTAIRTEMDSNSTQLAAIVEDTGTTLPGTLSTIAGYIDTEVAAILAAVDTEIGTLQTTATAIEADTQDIQSRLPAALNNGVMPADVQRINDVEVVGDGSVTPWGPA